MGGLLIYSGFYLDFIKPTKENNSTPIYVYHGMADPMVNWELAKASYELIDKTNREYNSHAEPGLEHTIGEEGLILMRKYFDKFIGRKPLEGI